MKRIALLFVAVLALVSNVSARNGSNANIEQVQDTTVLGKLYFVNLKEGEQPVMTGLSLHGNTCGTGAFNSKPYATEGIRSVFELDEWIEFHPQARVGGGIKVMVFQHKADQSFYLKNALNDKTPGYIQEQREILPTQDSTSLSTVSISRPFRLLMHGTLRKAQKIL